MPLLSLAAFAWAFKLLLAGGLILLLIFLISLAELFTQISRYKNHWDKINRAPSQSNEIIYIALGDSTAQGIGASSPSKGYVGLIAEHLRVTGDRPVRVINLSKSGAKVKDVLDTQLPALEKTGLADKAVITIEIGANDMAKFDKPEFEAQTDELLGRLPSQTLISDIPYFGGSRRKSLEANVLQANEIMYRLAKKHGIELVPLHERMKRNSSLKTLAVDGFHPSNTAYRENWARAFLMRLDSPG